ncbi:hypothetical protein C1H46_001336 [Malus baccata]|uniref:Rx N-terminal domain-containing protein n=1 Tax=Malus baccata TaxID=106549 RepID=A0A540NPJ8_MALBA|nr:hypothetical protein C1H46_001336 [Malus baccata]
MKHLRYLDLSQNPMERLPDWIVGLSNLETLDLTDCCELVELPRDINKMINLRHLNLQNCDQLTGVPHGIGERRRPKELGRMLEITELKKQLKITNLRHEKDVMFEPNLKEKQDIQSLTLKWIEGEDLKGVDEKDIIRSMEVLQPHSNLSELSVFYYGGVRFPIWFSSLTNIVKLKLFLCERCQHLPPLHHLPSLKLLHLLCLEKLEYISDNARDDDEVEMMRMSFFPSLEELRLEGCPVLKGWWRAHSHNRASSSSSTENLSPSFPILSTLKIWGCPNLTSMPLYPNVHKLDLWIVSSKVLPWLFVRGASDITHDVGVDVSASSSSPHLSKLTHLTLGETEDLEFILSEGMGTSLQELVIHHCPNLAALPEGIVNLTSLQSLRIEDCPNLAALPEGIANLTSLQSFSVENFPNWVAIPEGIANLTSLQSLRIEDCPNLASLPKEISNLTSLQQLEISNCSNLASLPEGISGLRCLKTLKISGCPMLSERCNKEIREDWPKIAHIPSIEIDKS